MNKLVREASPTVRLLVKLLLEHLPGFVAKGRIRGRVDSLNWSNVKGGEGFCRDKRLIVWSNKTAQESFEEIR